MPAVRLAAALLLLAAMAAAAAAPAQDEQPKKVGAGLLLCSEGKVLLLQRNSKHHDGTWALPGGNVEGSDGSLLSAATREAQEELGQVPPFQVTAQILTKRGKRRQKHFTVFVADVQPSVARALAPRLNEEHRAWRWVPWTDVKAAAAAAAAGNDGEQEEGGDSGAAGNGGGSTGGAALALHPVVVKLAQEHAADVQRALPTCAAGPTPTGG